MYFFFIPINGCLLLLLLWLLDHSFFDYQIYLGSNNHLHLCISQMSRPRPHRECDLSQWLKVPGGGGHKWYGLQSAGRVSFTGLVFGDHPHVHHGLIICVPHLCLLWPGKVSLLCSPSLALKDQGWHWRFHSVPPPQLFLCCCCPPRSFKLLL